MIINIACPLIIATFVYSFIGKRKCYGGIARLAEAVRKIKNDEENVVFLSGGDLFQGNVWYTTFKWRIIAEFANLLGFTASVSIIIHKAVN